ncbi:MAG: 4-hydroxy-tetrahydrodipicolinate synthase [Planctomycetota bacterium]|nr:MAG: 4-hydroxy-tetrahydrodipicolinate synthase [Planctomycetota bacterium]
MKEGIALRGCYTALITPFAGDGVDHAALRALVEQQVQAGVAGVVPCGTTGESPTLSHAEHREVIRTVVEAAQGRVQVIAGCGSNATAEAVELTRFAAGVGADATLQVVPYYNRPQQQGLVRHFRAVAEASPLPVVLYNIPGRSGVDLLPETVAELVRQAPNVVAIKEASGSPARVAELLALVPELSVLSGDDALTLPMLALGAKGVISVAANLVPERIQRLCTLFLGGDAAGALAEHRALWELFRALFCETNPVPVKFACALVHGTGEQVRLPLAPLGEPGRQRVRQALAALGLLPAA